MTDHEALVEGLVTGAMKGRDLDVLDELCTPELAPKVHEAFRCFATAFAEWHQELLELVAEGDTVVPVSAAMAPRRAHGKASRRAGGP